MFNLPKRPIYKLGILFFLFNPVLSIGCDDQAMCKKYFNEYSHLAIIEIGQTVADTNKKIDTKIGHLKSTLRPFFREDEYEYFKNNNYVEIRKKLNIDSYKDISMYESDIDGVQINIAKQNEILEEHKKEIELLSKKEKEIEDVIAKNFTSYDFLKPAWSIYSNIRNYFCDKRKGCEHETNKQNFLKAMSELRKTQNQKYLLNEKIKKLKEEIKNSKQKIIGKKAIIKLIKNKSRILQVLDRISILMLLKEYVGDYDKEKISVTLTDLKSIRDLNGLLVLSSISTLSLNFNLNQIDDKKVIYNAVGSLNFAEVNTLELEIPYSPASTESQDFAKKMSAMLSNSKRQPKSIHHLHLKGPVATYCLLSSHKFNKDSWRTLTKLTLESHKHRYNDKELAEICLSKESIKNKFSSTLAHIARQNNFKDITIDGPFVVGNSHNEREQLTIPSRQNKKINSLVLKNMKVHDVFLIKKSLNRKVNYAIETIKLENISGFGKKETNTFVNWLKNKSPKKLEIENIYNHTFLKAIENLYKSKEIPSLKTLVLNGENFNLI